MPLQRAMIWFGKHPVATLAAIGAISIASLFPASRVRIATSIDNLMMRNDPERDYYLETRELFGSEASALVYVEDARLFSARKLASLQELVFDLGNIDGIEAVESLFSVTDIADVDGRLDIRPLVDWLPESDAEAAAVGKRARAHPVIQRLLLSDDGTATAINLRLDTHNGHADEMHALCSAIEQALEPYLAEFQILEQLGRPYIIDQEAAYILRDQRVLLPMAVAVLALTLLFSLSSFKGAILPLLTSAVSILWTIGFMGLMDLPITELSFMVPSLIIVIGSTEDIHLLAEYKSGRMDGLDRHAAVRRMVCRLSVAVALTALTTFAGFVSIIASPMPVLRDFGIVASFGLLANPLATFAMIPACLALFPDRADKGRRGRRPSALAEGLLHLLARSRRHPKTTLAAVCIPCIAAGLYGACYVKADNNIIGFFDPGSAVVRRVDRLHATLSGSESFCIRINAVRGSTFKDPANLRYAAGLQQHLEQSGWIDRSIGLTDYLAYVHGRFGTGASALPETRQGVAECLLLLHRNEIEPYATPDLQHLNIVVRHNLRSSRELLPRIAALREHIAQTCPAGLDARVTGEMLLVHKAVGAIVRGQLRGILIIACVAAALISLVFRSIRIGCMAMVPNLLPIGIQFGAMAAAGIPLNTATSMAAAIGIGLAVDDTIHLLMRFYNQDKDMAPEAALDESLRHLLRPIVASSMSLAAGFLAMRFSTFTPIGDFGALAALVLAAALVADLLVTPALLSLRIMHRSAGYRRQQTPVDEPPCN